MSKQDLVTQLRAWNGNSFGPYSSPVPDLLAAADEIETLERIIREDVASKEALRMRRMVELCRDTFADFQVANRILGRALQADAARAGYDACVRCLEAHDE